MAMQLVFDNGCVVPLQLDPHAQEVWAIQYGRAIESNRLDQLMERIGSAFSAALFGCLDYDLQVPSDAKVQFATAISRELGISLPAEALRFRGAMDEFLDRFADTYKNRQKR